MVSSFLNVSIFFFKSLKFVTSFQNSYQIKQRKKLLLSVLIFSFVDLLEIASNYIPMQKVPIVKWLI